MTNQAILSIFDYLCNEARNSVHGLFGLMEVSGDTASDFAWRGYIDGGRSGTDRLLRSIDDVRELLGPELPAGGTAEEFEAALCLGEAIDLLNLAAASQVQPHRAGGSACAPGAAARPAGAGTSANAGSGHRIETLPGWRNARGRSAGSERRWRAH